MSRKFLNSILLVVLAAFSITLQAAESPYNKGVDAWRIKDYAEARKQWEMSLAKGGPDETFNNLAYLLFYGLGGEANEARAIALWRKGAALAVSEAQWHLGRAYDDGRGVARNASQAYAWYQCAIATASRRAPNDKIEAEIRGLAEASLAKLRPGLSQAELTDAERLAKDLISKYSVPRAK